MNTTLNNMLPFNICHIASSKNESGSTHMHNEIEIIYVVKGTIRLFADRSILKIASGCIAFINSYEAHKILQASDDAEYFILNFTPELIYLYDNDFISKEYFLWLSSKKDNSFSLHDATDTEIPDLFFEINELYNNKKYTYELKISANILILCTFLYKKWFNLDAAFHSIDTTIDDVYSAHSLFNKIYDEFRKLSNKEASIQALSKLSSATLFKKISGFTPLKYFEKLKMNYALCVLNSTEKTITEIAFSLGFSNSSYFSKCFLSFFGISPSNVRNVDNIKKLKTTAIQSNEVTPVNKQEKNIDELIYNREYFFYNYTFIAVYCNSKISSSIGMHDFYNMIFIDSGSMIIEFKDETIALSTGDIIMIPPYANTKITQKTDYLLNIQFQFFPEIFSFGQNNNPLINDIKLCFEKKTILKLPEKDSQYLIKTLLDIFEQRKKYTSYTEILLRANAFKIASMFMENTSIYTEDDSKDNGSKTNTLEKIILYIYTNYTKKLSLTVLANQFDISYSYLSAKFKERTGKTFNSYINELRITRAHFLLLTTNYTIDKISSLLGYCRRSHFTDEFIKKYGITPSEFRKRIKTKKPVFGDYKFIGHEFLQHLKE